MTIKMGRKSEPRKYKLNISNLIREKRLAKGLSQADLSDRLGIRPQSANYYERGKNQMHAVTLIMLMNELDITIDEVKACLVGPESEIK